MQANRNAIPDALRHFDDLPPSAWVRIRVVQGLLGCSRATIYRMEADGRLPRHENKSPGCAVWQVGKLRQALSSEVS